VARKYDRATFLVAGSILPAPGTIGNIVATGPVADSRPWFQACDIALCPVECRCGTKIKLIESLAFGLPAVAFAEALYGTALEHGKHLLVAGKSEQALVSALDRLLDDPDFADRLAREGRRYVAEHHSWRRIAQVLESALLQLVEPGAPSSSALTSSHSR
jgi:glycosyltransferase involved in cell wall biosynthesis